MPAEPKYEKARFDAISPVQCPCGESRRVFADGEDRTVSLHEVRIAKTSQSHYHKRLTEVYHILEGEGYLELDGERLEVAPGDIVKIRPLCRHRAVGDLKILNIVVPAFDPADEWTD